jgi:hypothetical protein
MLNDVLNDPGLKISSVEHFLPLKLHEANRWNPVTIFSFHDDFSNEKLGGTKNTKKGRKLRSCVKFIAEHFCFEGRGRTKNAFLMSSTLHFGEMKKFSPAMKSFINFVLFFPSLGSLFIFTCLFLASFCSLMLKCEK